MLKHRSGSAFALLSVRLFRQSQTCQSRDEPQSKHCTSFDDAEDQTQETFLRAWRSRHTFAGRSSLRTWLYRIATNACLDLLERRGNRIPLPPTQDGALPEVAYLQPYPDELLDQVTAGGDGPDEAVVSRETIELAFLVAVQHLPPRQRAVLILRDVLRWRSSEVAQLLDTSTASVNSALQRARATLATADVSAAEPIDDDQRALLARYVDAFERYDLDALTSLLHEDATWSMPPYELWLQSHDDIRRWGLGPGIGCRGSRLVPTFANGSPAFGQYKPSPDGGREPWSLQVLELSGGRISGISFFLDTASLFPLFGLPPRLDEDVAQPDEGEQLL